MLKRSLGLPGVFSIAAGAMISSGLFVLPGIAYQQAGPSVILSYALAGLLMIPAMLSLAELATAMPKSGGSYFFVERSMGALAGTVAGLANWFAIALKATFALVGIGALAMLLVPAWGELGLKLTAIGACVVLTAVNIVSVKSTGRLQAVMVVGLLAIVGVFVAVGIFAVREARYIPFVPAGLSATVAAAGMVFVSFGGLTKVVDVGEEVRHPGRTIPLGMFLAFAVVNVLYVLVVFVTVGTVDADRLAGSPAAVSLSAGTTMGLAGEAIVSLGALLAFVTTANAGILSASRSPMAMSRDGLLPTVFSRTNRRFGTPHVAIVATSSLMIVVISLLSVAELAKAASTMMILMFILANAAVVIMRQSGIQSYRPRFKAPLNPWLQIATIVVYALLIVEMGAIPLWLTLAFALAVAIWYAAYVHHRIDRESALVYLVKRITSKAIQRSGLEDELKTISLERDAVELDRFDHLVKECVILDIEEGLSARELFSRVADALAERLDVTRQALYELFLERERESSTVVQPGLAIPHVIVKGHRLFDVVLVRCKGGVSFSELHQPVRTAFVLIGSPDQRNYHLRALMTIARIVQEPDFHQRWSQARGVEQLRDVVLLSTRQRENHA